MTGSLPNTPSNRKDRNDRRNRRTRSDRGDAGLPLLLIVPALLVIVMHLVNATQQLYERREAYAVASSAARFGNQADQLAVRTESAAAIDQAKSEDSIRRYVASEGYNVTNLQFDSDRGDGTFTITVEVERDIDFVFPSLLDPSVSGQADSVLNRGVTGAGTP